MSSRLSGSRHYLLKPHSAPLTRIQIIWLFINKKHLCGESDDSPERVVGRPHWFSKMIGAMCHATCCEPYIFPTSLPFIWACERSSELACWMFRMGVSVLVNRRESQLFRAAGTGLACGHYLSMGHWVKTLLVWRTTQKKHLRFKLLFICISLKLIGMWTNSVNRHTVNNM